MRQASLYAADGTRKYLNAIERRRFLRVAQMEERRTKALCLTLAYTGCRISEALSLTAAAVQQDAGVIAIRTLKRRGQLIVREVPVPKALLRILAGQRGKHPTDTLLWHCGRTLAWRQVKAVMRKAGIAGRHASPRGLRHGFGIHAVQCGVPLNLVQKWLGHANIATTAIYTNAVGPEEHAIARRMWKESEFD